MFALSALAWIPLGATLVVGTLFLADDDAKLSLKIAGIAVFGVAIFFQFFSSYGLMGLYLQIGLAICLEFWRQLRYPRRV